jgi:single-stranded DNA-specific DHH superfamily exonuclease
MIITDHHEKLPELPDAIAVINPHVSPQYEFK